MSFITKETEDIQVPVKFLQAMESIGFVVNYEDIENYVREDYLMFAGYINHAQYEIMHGRYQRREWESTMFMSTALLTELQKFMFEPVK